MSFLKNRAKNSFVFTSEDEQSIVAPAVTFIGLSITDNGGNTQISSAGVHGLTTGGAAGYDVYVSWSGGTGVDGFYTVLTVDDTDSVTIDLPYAVGLGTPTVAVIGTEVEVSRMTIPAGVMEIAGSFFKFAALNKMVAQHTGRTISIYINDVFMFSDIPASNFLRSIVGVTGFATGANGAQFVTSPSPRGLYSGSSTNDAYAFSIADIGAAFDISITITPTVADKFTSSGQMYFEVVKP